MADIAGMVLITPSSVSGSGVTLTGAKVEFSGATSLSVNGVFSTTYDNYVAVVKGVTTGGDNIQMRLRASGSDNSTSNSYQTQSMQAAGTTPSGFRITSNLANVAEMYGVTMAGFVITFYSPALAVRTNFRTVTAADASGAYLNNYAGDHNQTTAYDGFTLFLPTYAITGSLTVYGLSQ